MGVIVALFLTTVDGTARFLNVKNKASSNAFHYVATLCFHPLQTDLTALLERPASVGSAIAGITALGSARAVLMI